MKKIVLILFAVLCGAVAAVAQKAVVESFEAAPMDVTAQKYARLDKHGEKCALVKVSVVAPNVTFQGNVMGDVQKRQRVLGIPHLRHEDGAHLRRLVPGLHVRLP